MWVWSPLRDPGWKEGDMEGSTQRWALESEGEQGYVGERWRALARPAVKGENVGRLDCRGKASSLLSDGHPKFTPVLSPLGLANSSAEKDSTLSNGKIMVRF